MYNKTRGFSIVELLIVIVVLGILASVTLVTYSGIQKRAQNVKTISAASHYLNLLEIYHIDNKAYPAMPDPSIVDMCLGTVYTVDPIYGPDCVVTSPNGKKASATDQFYAYTNSDSLPEPSTVGYSNGPVLVRGVRLSFLSNQRLDGEPQQWWLTYVLAGTPARGACGVGEVAYGNWNGGFSTNMTMVEPANGLQGDPIGGSAIQCRVPLIVS